MARTVGTVGVVGLGTMGAGIVEVLARGGLAVTAVDVDEAAVARGEATLRRSTDRAVARGKLTEAAAGEVHGRVTFGVGLAALADVDLVVEAVPERLDLKLKIFGELDGTVRPDAILATNTSSLSVTEIAAGTAYPGRVVGMHFFNPAPVMKLVEVIRTVRAADDAVAAVVALAGRLGKTAVTVGDRAGFIANALLFGYLNQAVAMVESGHATREDVDAAMAAGCGLPMGPLTLLDLIGLDVAVEILDVMYASSRSRRHAATPLLRELVAAGLLGRKSGRGLYTYEAPGSRTVVPDAADAGTVVAGRPVHTVGVVGAGEDAQRWAQDCEVVGYTVSRAADEDELGSVAGADFVVVAAGTDPALFAQLAAKAGPDTVLATTAGGPVVGYAATSGRAAATVGVYDRHPVAGSGLVEVVSSVVTAADATATAAAVCERAGRTPVRCRDRVGRIVDALLHPYLNDAIGMVEAGYASVDDVDHAMTLGCGYPAGPFAMLDAVDPRTVLETLRRLYEESGEPGFAPAPLLGQFVTAGLAFRQR